MAKWQHVKQFQDVMTNIQAFYLGDISLSFSILNG